MNCFLCNTEMKFYFKKLHGNDFWKYVRCDKCGIVLNETVYKMTDEEWKKLNEEQHKDYQQTDENIVDPNWISRLRTQTEVICQMYKNKIFEVNMKAVDYGCGDGKFSDYLQEKYYEKNGKNLFLINKYDEYMQPINSEGVLSKTEIKKNTFDLVVTCSVFEHLIGIDDVDKIISLLNENGVLALHTLVCEEVPQDSNWFYLLPVHITLWTNKAMIKLYDKYNFIGCAYNVESRMWFLFKNKERFEKLKQKSGNIYGTWVIKENFVDYWKLKPYRTDFK